MPKKIYTTERPLGKEHQVELEKELYTTERDLGFERFTDLTKITYDVDALTAFFLLTEGGDFLQLEQGGRIVNFYG